ncbi:MAG: tetratricopeptide repeat protein [Desulfobacterales bacterium]|nr:tetratricopeptide repeat protein [Desulfobacterales bacterium]
MAKKKRVTRKQLLKEPDEFLTFSAKAIRFVADNQRPVFGVAIGVAVVLLAFAGFQYFSNLSERRAYAMFEQGRLNYLAEISGNKTTPAKEKEQAAGQFEEVIRKYPSTNAARFSLIVYADMSYHRGDYQKAIELYKKALGAFSGEVAIQKLILNGLAHAYEAKKDYRSAAEYFQKITDTQDEFMKGDTYYNLGRMMEALNRPEKALEAYNKVLQDYPDSAGFRIAKEKVLW